MVRIVASARTTPAKYRMSFYSLNSYWMRPVVPSDLGTLATHRNQEGTWQGLTDPLPIYEHNQRSWFESLGGKNFYFIGGYKNEEVGFIRFTDVDYKNSNACVGCDVFLHYRGEGHAANLMRLILSYCFDILNLNRAWLLVADYNIPAKKVYTKVGFVEEGRMRDHLFRDGSYHDYILMGLLRKDFKI